MSGLFTTLRSSAAALNAQSQAISIAGNNIANVNNPNYAEESANFNSLGMVQTASGPESLGMSVTVSSNRSAVLDGMVRQENSLTAGFTAQQNLFQQAQAALGENITSTSTSGTASTATDSGLGTALNSFFNAFSALAANPTDSGAKESLVEQAGVLTDRFQEVSQNLSQVQANATASVNSDVTSANSLLQNIATLNSQIASFEVGDPGSAVDLRDQREGDLEQLASLVPVTVTEDAQGEDTVTAATAASPGSVTLVSQGTVSNTLSYSSGQLLAGTAVLSATSGSMAGTIASSVGGVQTLMDNLDSLAKQIVTAVNATYNPSNTTGGNFFLSSALTAGTIAVDPHLTATSLAAGAATGAAGDNSIALAVSNLANQSFSTSGGDVINGTLGQYYANAASGIGQALDTANTQVTDQTNVQTIVNNQRASASGVSLDQEMSNLMTFQQAYQASAEVFQSVNSMLSDLLSTLASVT
ncbi:MAG TPA: flagellar hook-associated protein FlgK [Opitutaceae bacterium]|jgi:flagellar hook-associated protein 1 FlgK|nr:flagellar hook-associated protein FlgK [Opitutaceae bacterium]